MTKESVKLPFQNTTEEEKHLISQQYKYKYDNYNSCSVGNINNRSYITLFMCKTDCKAVYKKTTISLSPFYRKQGIDI